MDIEKLKELKNQIEGGHSGINGDDFKLLYNLLPLVDEEIARQSVKSEETDGCEWCKEKLYFTVVWHDYVSSFVDKADYCPNCGRKLKEKE